MKKILFAIALAYLVVRYYKMLNELDSLFDEGEIYE